MTRRNVPASSPQPTPLWGYLLVGGTLFVGMIVFRKVIISNAEPGPAPVQPQGVSRDMTNPPPAPPPGLTRRTPPASKTLGPYLPRSERQFDTRTMNSPPRQPRVGTQRLSGIQGNSAQNRSAQPLD